MKLSPATDADADADAEADVDAGAEADQPTNQPSRITDDLKMLRRQTKLKPARESQNAQE